MKSSATSIHHALLGLAAFVMLSPSAATLAGQQQISINQGTSSFTTCQIPDVDGVVRCGSVEVFEDRQTRGGRRIRLKVVVLTTSSNRPQPDPLFILAGGPGQAATDNVEFYAKVFSAVRRERDIVLVDQRGTGDSNPLKCDLYGKTVQAHLDDLLPPDTIRTCVGEWKTHADLRFYTTPIAVDDIDEVRASLGYQKLNLFGTSYGTRVAQVYARKYPSRVRSIILKGITPISENIAIALARDAQHSIDLVFRECAADETCRNAYPGFKQEFETVLKRFSHGPVSLDLTGLGSRKTEHVRLYRGAFVTTVRSMLQSTGTIGQLPQLIHQAYNDDYVPFTRAVIAVREGFAEGIGLGTFLAVINAEDLPLAEPELVRHAALGTFMGDYYYQQLRRVGSLLPRGSLPSQFKEPLKSDLPALLISGYLDPATPVANGTQVARTLTGSVHVVIRNASHSYTGLSPCVDGIMADFLSRGKTQGLDTSCVEEIPKISFKH